MVRATRNERYRLGTQIRKGMEIQRTDGSWVAVAFQMYITAPLRIVSIELVGGERIAVQPRAQVMSRIPEGSE